MPTKDSLFVWARQEQASLWHDLDHAVTFAANGVWSMDAEAKTYRLVQCIRLVGPIPPGDVPWKLLGGGVATAVLELAGGPSWSIPATEWDDWDQVMSGYGTRSDLQVKMAHTIVAMRADTQLKADLEEEA